MDQDLTNRVASSVFVFLMYLWGGWSMKCLVFVVVLRGEAECDVQLSIAEH